jgi:uridine kinase
MRPRIVGIAGHARSGKTTAAQHLGRTFGAKVFRNSEIISHIISRTGMTRDRITYARLSTAIFDVFGNDIIARHWLRVIGEAPSTPVHVVEGIRYLEELEIYRASSHFILLGITSSNENRFFRSGKAADSEKDRGRTYEEFLEQKQLRNESFVDSIVAQANLVIENDGSMEEFTSRIDAAMAKLL